MKSYRIAAALLILVAAATSCNRSARIEGVLAEAPESEVIVKLLDVTTIRCWTQ